MSEKSPESHTEKLAEAKKLFERVKFEQEFRAEASKERPLSLREEEELAAKRAEAERVRKFRELYPPGHPVREEFERKLAARNPAGTKERPTA